MGINLIWNIIFILALSQGVFLGIVHLIQYIRNRLPSHLFLSLFVLTFSYILLYNLLYWNGLLLQYPQLLLTNMSVRFLLPPLFFLYFKSLVERKIQLKEFIHFLPFLIVLSLYLPIMFPSNTDELELLRNIPDEVRIYWTRVATLSSFTYAILLLAYPAYIFFHLNRSIKKTNLEQTEKMNQLLWLRLLNTLFLCYGLLMIAYYILVHLSIGGIEKDYYISVVLCISIYLISYIGMIHPELLKGSTFLEKVTTLKYKKAKLTDSYLESIISKIDDLMLKETVFLDADYNLNQLAQTLNISRHHISQALSLILNKSFNEYINIHRIDHAKTLLKELEEGQNIKTVMYESGFNNRVSFNNNFKKMTGLTASEYLGTLKK